MDALKKISREQAGFTLIEMMVSVLVMGILMAIAIPTIQLQIARQELQGAGREVVEVLRAARDSAINEGVPRYVLFRETDESYQLYRFDATHGWVPNRDEVSLRTGVSFTGSDVTFPSLADTPVPGAAVPAHAAYFDTRGRHSTVGWTYQVTLRGRMGRTLTLTIYPQTGAVTGL